MPHEKQFVRLTAALLMAFGLIGSVQVALAAADSIEVHVAPAGDDAGDGSRTKPVASLIGARDAVRRLRAAGKAGPVRVVVADGTYRFAEPLVLTPEDGGTAEAPLRYEAAPGANPVFSGGRTIAGFKPLGDGVWAAQVPEVADGKWYFEQLWIDGKRAVRAREPNRFWHYLQRVEEEVLSAELGADGRLYLIHDNEEDAYLAAFDSLTGKQLWRTPRPPETNWSTPLVWQNDQRTELVVSATGGITSYDLNGQPLWELHGMSRITVPNPLAGNGLLYVGSGFVADRQKPLYAIRPGAAGDISLKEGESGNRHVAWRQENAAPYVPSFLVAGRHLYVIKDNGQLACYDAVTGAEVYQERLRGHFTASPWMCGERLFLLNEQGDTYVVQAGPVFKILATNTLERLCLSTPAVAGDRLLIRTSSRLYCIRSDQ